VGGDQPGDGRQDVVLDGGDLRGDVREVER